MKKTLLVFFLLLTTGETFAHDFAVEGIYYNKLSDGKSVAVTCEGLHYDSYTNEYTGPVTIPDKVTYDGTTYSVTSIGDQAFDGCKSLTSVTIPNSVTSIGYNAFFGCSNLTFIAVDENNAKYSSINGILFDKNHTTIIRYPASIKLQKYDIPNTVAFIEKYAFSVCKNLTSVTIPNSVTYIGNYAFYGCNGLTSMTIGNSVTYIGNNAFSDCSNIKYLTYNSKSYLNSYFTNFTNLTKVTLGDSVEIIGDKAFAGCTKLSSVRIGRMVSSIGTNAFNDCTGLFDMYSYIISPANVKLGTTAFGASINRCVLHVLKGAERIYSTTDQWKKFFISEDLSLASSDYEIKMTVEGSGVYSVLKYAGGATFSMSAAAETGYEVGSVKLDGVEQGSGNISFTVNANHSIVITPKSTNGLAKVEATKNMTCWVSDGKVFVSSSSQLDGVTVYDMGGRIIAKSTIKDYIYTIPIKTDTDAVIVKSGSESVRILVK